MRLPSFDSPVSTALLILEIAAMVLTVLAMLLVLRSEVVVMSRTLWLAYLGFGLCMFVIGLILGANGIPGVCK